jgi:hypothetical protein
MFKNLVVKCPPLRKLYPRPWIKVIFFNSSFIFFFFQTLLTKNISLINSKLRIQLHSVADVQRTFVLSEHENHARQRFIDIQLDKIIWFLTKILKMTILKIKY